MELKLWLSAKEISEIEGSMGRPGFASTWSYATISNLLKDRISLIELVEQQQIELEEISKWRKKSRTIELLKEIAEKDTLIASLKEEIEKLRSNLKDAESCLHHLP